MPPIGLGTNEPSNSIENAAARQSQNQPSNSTENALARLPQIKADSPPVSKKRKDSTTELCKPGAQQVKLAKIELTRESVLDKWMAQAVNEEDRYERYNIKLMLLETAELHTNGTLVINGHLDLSHCRALTSLPSPLIVMGHLDLTDCIGLTSLPECLEVHGGLYLGGCGNLTCLPEGLCLRDSLILEGCTCLTKLPVNLRVDGDFILSGCTGITSLPNQLFIGGDCILSECTGITTLPANLLDYFGDLDLSGCTSLRYLPDNLHVCQSLNLSGCIGLIELPHNLFIEQDLNLWGCTSLRRLGNNLQVNGGLDLIGCTGLVSLPDNIRLGGDIDFSDCINLTSLPDWIRTIGPSLVGSRRVIDLTNTGLSQVALNNLSAIEIPNVSFLIGEEVIKGLEYNTLNEALASWLPNVDDVNAQDWALTTIEQRNVTIFLSRLHHIADANNIGSRANMQARIAAFVEHMTVNNNDYRFKALEEISNVITDCEDRVSFFFNTIDILTRTHQAAASAYPKKALIDLAQSLIALEVVHKHAAAKCKALNLSHESIEVYLAFEIKLKHALALPVSTEDMFYASTGELSPSDIDAAKQDALAVLADPDNLNVFLAQWEPWQQFERREQIAQTTWQDLMPSEQRFLPIDRCSISHDSLAEITDPVCVGKNLYSFESLAQWWVKSGTEPATTIPIILNNIHKVIMTSDATTSTTEA